MIIILYKRLAVLLACLMAATLLASCTKKTDGPFDGSYEITVLSREEGSGTRGAFVELFGVEEKNSEGKKVDRTTVEANISNSTAVVMTAVEGYRYAIGYISLGSLNSGVKALEIDGAAPTPENIADGSYAVARPFLLAHSEGLSDEAADFLTYILSAEGQQVVADSGYIPLNTGDAYTGVGMTGKVVVAGSSSVTPVMEKLKESYLAHNPSVTIEVQQSDSTTGITSVRDGIADLGMASRTLGESELAQGLIPVTIAMDGIVVIVNHENPIDGLTKEQVRGIYTGEVLTWGEVLS